MEFERCKLCGEDLEDIEYTHVVSRGISPDGLDICFKCLKKLKEELDKL